MKIAIGNRRTDKCWKNSDISWEDFCLKISSTLRTTETVEEYQKMKKGRQDEIKDVGGFVGGHLAQGRRRNGNVLCRSMLTLDMDYATRDVWEQIQSLYDYKCCVYSTHKHTAEHPRLRLIIPLSREISEDEYPAVSRMVAKEIGMDMFDDTTYEPCRLMYWPSTPVNGVFFSDVKTGVLLDPDSYLARYDDWRDVSTWPVSSRQSEVAKRTVSMQADPLIKPGVIGAFCRAYAIEDAIETFLADVYAPSAVTGRFDYIPADSSAGLVLYDGRFAYSHHATDPACGKLLNAFDLVRIHKFRDLDEQCPANTPAAKLPSFKAMGDFAVKDEKVKAVLAADRMARAETEFCGENWQAALDIDKTGKIKDTLTNISIILKYDENLKNIVYNQFKNMLDVVGALPWKQVKPGWSDTDLACAKMYFERMYGIWSPTKFKDALLAVASAERLYHPVKDYLSALKWDGVKRVDTLLVDYLGAEDTPYVRAVTRKTLVAANVRLHPFQPCPGGRKAVRLHAEGHELCADNAVVASGDLVVQHFHILLPDAVVLVVLHGDIDAVPAFRAAPVIEEGELERKGAVKVIEAGAPPVKDGRLIFGLGELVVDVLILDGFRVVVLRHPAHPVPVHFPVREGLLGGGGNVFFLCKQAEKAPPVRLSCCGLSGVCPFLQSASPPSRLTAHKSFPSCRAAPGDRGNRCG